MAALSASSDLVTRLVRIIEGLAIESTDRKLLAGACFHQSIEHHDAIAHLIRERFLGSALALIRPQWESYIRGIWLSKCATDPDIERFKRGTVKQSFADIVVQIESLDDYYVGIVSVVKKESWKTMHDYAHGSGRHMTRRLSPDSIVPNHPPEDIDEALNFSNATGILAVTAVAFLADRPDITQEILKAMKVEAVR